MAASNVTPLRTADLSQNDVEKHLHELRALGELLLAAGVSDHEITSDTVCSVGGAIMERVAEIEEELGIESE